MLLFSNTFKLSTSNITNIVVVVNNDGKNIFYKGNKDGYKISVLGNEINKDNMVIQDGFITSLSLPISQAISINFKLNYPLLYFNWHFSKNDKVNELIPKIPGIVGEKHNLLIDENYSKIQIDNDRIFLIPSEIFSDLFEAKVNFAAYIEYDNGISIIFNSSKIITT